METQRNITGCFQDFRNFEDENHLFDRKIGDVSYWHLIRFSVFTELLLPGLIPIHSGHPDMIQKKKSFSGRVRFLLKRICYALRGGSWNLPDNTDTLFVLAPRKIRTEHGMISLMLDFFYDKVAGSKGILEIPLKEEHHAYAIPRHVMYLESAMLSLYRARLESRNPQKLREITAEIHDLHTRLSQAFPCHVEEEKFQKLLLYSLTVRSAYLPFFQKLLRKKHVRSVVCSVHYDPLIMTMTEAAHSLQIPVTELQHGTIYRCHAAYNLPPVQSVYTPDRLLSWGKYWNSQTENFAADGIYATGYSYLEYFFKRYPPRRSASDKKVLVISQGSIGKELSAVICKLRKYLPQGIGILYKLHPNETKTWKQNYPHLVQNGITVLDDPSIPVYFYFQTASCIVGIYSTAVIEAFCWGLKAFIFRSFPGSETMENFCRNGNSEFVETAEEAAGKIVTYLNGETVGDGLGVDTEYWMDSASRRTAEMLSDFRSASAEKEKGLFQ